MFVLLVNINLEAETMLNYVLLIINIEKTKFKIRNLLFFQDPQKIHRNRTYRDTVDSNASLQAEPILKYKIILVF